MDDMENRLSESGEQFAEIFEEHHDPLKKERRKIELHKIKRAEDIKKDTGAT